MKVAPEALGRPGGMIVGGSLYTRFRLPILLNGRFEQVIDLLIVLFTSASFEPDKIDAGRSSLLRTLIGAVFVLVPRGRLRLL